MRKFLFLLALSLCSIAARAYSLDHDFSAVAPTGQTMYYKITSSSAHTVGVTYSGYSPPQPVRELAFTARKLVSCSFSRHTTPG